MSNGDTYSWFREAEAFRLAAMLNAVADDQEVAELVLLGDIFDLWLYPVSVAPCTVSQIADCNPAVSNALRRCVANLPNVYYMNGNHDMDAGPADLEVFDSEGKTIQLATTEGYKQAHGGLRHFEHGHEADMFNAAYDRPDALEGYPFGYFITRLVASGPPKEDPYEDVRNAVQQFHLTHLAAHPLAEAKNLVASVTVEIGKALVEPIVDVLAIHAGVNDSTAIVFADPTIRHTVGDIKAHYGSLCSWWADRFGISSDFLRGMFGRDDLDWYARKVLAAMPAGGWVVMGHTHHAMSAPSYDNDGCYCASASGANYVVMEPNKQPELRPF